MASAKVETEGGMERGDDGSIWPRPRDDEVVRQIRAGVRALCAGFPGAYWRELDRERALPPAFVEAPTRAGYLARLIPPAHGGGGAGARGGAGGPGGSHPPRGDAAGGHRP